ncbi:membrane protein implicated in regulation of membrane protease activity [Alkalihalobacillus xiaoxiensis]|uniref:Membrane protein implicated in regulation of membrane protease activity n=1 Tax=Shouchella xiaoxiensis TaxID=766895 RepID=A0ABS2SYG2_9BACI|nr:NfeD family protein [Shouchella xiaoxiensis]MBM7840559.1 membrane protein implicated in regulation of membrane protease activity [Shouchella xiaoxiensis]
MELTTMYFTILLVSGGLTIIYVLLSDVLDGLFDVFDGWLSPTLILSTLSFFGASAYILERFAPFTSPVSAAIAVAIALILAILFNLFILTPLQHTEESNAYSDEDLEGRTGEIILSIPEDGFGEVIMRGDSGTISKTASSVDGTVIQSGTNVVIVKIEHGIAYVAPLDFEDSF